MVDADSIIGKVFVQIIDDFHYLSEKYISKKKDIEIKSFDGKVRPPMGVAWNTYLRTAGYRTIIKDLWFFASIIGFFVFMGWTMLNIDKITQPTIAKPIGNGEWIKYTGNCDWFWKEYQKYNLVEHGEMKDMGLMTNISPESVREQIAMIKVNSSEVPGLVTTTTTMQQCEVCQKCICPPPCQEQTSTTLDNQNNVVYEMSDDMKHILLNMRMKKPGNSDCVQYGYNICKADYLTYLGLKNTYNGQTIYDTRIGWNNINTTITDDMFCFQKQNGSMYGLSKHWIGFGVDLSIWNMNHTLVNITTWNMTTYSYSSYTNHSNYTTWQTLNISTIILNDSKNWFVYKVET
jgi:hypothetical protein